MLKYKNIKFFLKFILEEFVEYINYTRKLEFEQEPNYEYLRGLFRSVMVKNDYKNDLQFDWIKPIIKDDKISINSKLTKINQNQGSISNLVNNVNLNTISNCNNMNTIHNSNSLGKINLNLNNDANNINIYTNNVSTTKNSNQYFVYKSNSKIQKTATIETNAKFTGFNYNYNYPINNISAQRASINNLSSSKLNFIDIAPKTNKNEAFPTL